MLSSVGISFCVIVDNKSTLVWPLKKRKSEYISSAFVLFFFFFKTVSSTAIALCIVTVVQLWACGRRARKEEEIIDFGQRGKTIATL